MTSPSRSTLVLNLDSFRFLVEQVLPQVRNGLQFWSPRHTGTDRDEQFFGEMRRKCRALDALTFWSTFWSAAQVQLWCAVPQRIRGFPVHVTGGGNTYRGYDSHSPSLSLSFSRFLSLSLTLTLSLSLCALFSLPPPIFHSPSPFIHLTHFLMCKLQG